MIKCPLHGQVRTAAQSQQARQRYRDKQRNRFQDTEAKVQKLAVALEAMRCEKVYLPPLPRLPAPPATA